MHELVFVVTVIDFAYSKPFVKIAYAGTEMSKAETIFHRHTDTADEIEVYMDLVQGETTKRLETKLRSDLVI